MSTANALVALLLPVHNAEQFLPQCLESIIVQTYQHWHLIAVNDGSTDQSAQLLEQFRLAHPDQVTILTIKQNQGLVPTLNLGLTKITTLHPTYVARLDSDDYLHPQRLQTQVTFLNLHRHVDILGSNMRLVNQNNRLLNKKRTYSRHTALFSAFCFYNPLFHPTLMWRQSWAEQIKFHYSSQFPQAEDYDAWTRYAFQTTFTNLPNYLYYYRLHDQQISTAQKAIQAKQTTLIKTRFQADFLQHYQNQPSRQKLLNFIMARNWPKKIKIELLRLLVR